MINSHFTTKLSDRKKKKLKLRTCWQSMHVSQKRTLMISGDKISKQKARHDVQPTPAQTHMELSSFHNSQTSGAGLDDAFPGKNVTYGSNSRVG